MKMEISTRLFSNQKQVLFPWVKIIPHIHEHILQEFHLSGQLSKYGQQSAVLLQSNPSAQQYLLKREDDEDRLAGSIIHTY